jgi:hypothetical protein
MTLFRESPLSQSLTTYPSLKQNAGPGRGFFLTTTVVASQRNLHSAPSPLVWALRFKASLGPLLSGGGVDRTV